MQALMSFSPLIDKIVDVRHAGFAHVGYGSIAPHCVLLGFLVVFKISDRKGASQAQTLHKACGEKGKPVVDGPPES